MFHHENELLANLVVLSPKLARRKFRESIFEAWNWTCIYCDRQLSEKDATIDHIVPKHKGGHSTRNNLTCACNNCNRAKGSLPVFEYMSPAHVHYSEQRVDRIKQWMEQEPCSLMVNSTGHATPYICHDATLGWIAS